MTYARIEREFAGRRLVLETGKWAKQADGAVTVTYGDTMVLGCVQSAPAREGIDFFPLTVDYREKTYAAGKFPGGFFKREARPTQKEVLTCRLIDRPLRPMFPEGYVEDLQVMCTVLSFDGDVDPDIVAMIASFAAINISSIPFVGPMGACRIGQIDGKLVVNPGCAALAGKDNRLNLTVAATRDALVMVEAGARGVDEAVILEALEVGHKACIEICDMIAELVKKVGTVKKTFEAPKPRKDLDDDVTKTFAKPVAKAVTAKGGKHDRKAAIDEVKKELKAHYEEKFADLPVDEKAASLRYVLKKFEGLKDAAEREAILKGTRTDGRKHEAIRPISSEVSILARAHGSAVFTRGETQALVVATLGTIDDEQIIDGLEEEYRKKFLLHYNFPPFSVGETRPIRGPGRREIGHGALAERAIEAVLPSHEEFPYTVRLVSEILESNGSSSMATVCASTLALMDAGVPIRQPVAGIAMGLVKEGRRTAILSDIQGSEDHCGDMDFKVAGTQHGITALQMDIKCEGLTSKLLEKALAQAKTGRIHILKEMLHSLRRPRRELSRFAPRLVQLKISPDKIGAVIGPGGKHIRGLQEETKTKINVEDDGTVTIAGVIAEGVERATRHIELMTKEVQIGDVYRGRIVSIKEFGAFIEILPGQEGLCHVSELSDTFIRAVTDVVQIGDEIEIKVIDIDPLGKIKLSRRALLEGGGGDDESPRRRERPERRDRPERGEHRDRGDSRERGESRERSESRDRDEVRDRVEPHARVEPRERGERDDRERPRGRGRRPATSRDSDRGDGRRRSQHSRPRR